MWLRGATVARLTPDQKAACSNHVGVNWIFYGNRYIWNLGLIMSLHDQMTKIEMSANLDYNGIIFVK